MVRALAVTPDDACQPVYDVLLTDLGEPNVAAIAELVQRRLVLLTAASDDRC